MKKGENLKIFRGNSKFCAEFEGKFLDGVQLDANGALFALVSLFLDASARCSHESDHAVHGPSLSGFCVSMSRYRRCMGDTMTRFTGLLRSLGFRRHYYNFALM